MSIPQPDRQTLATFVKKHASDFYGTVVDIGGGNRRYASLFSNAKKFVVLDVNKKTNPDIVADAEKLPLPDASADGVICTQVLGDVWNITVAIEEMHRILKQNGLLMITEALHAEAHDEPTDYWRFTKYAWKKLLEDKYDILVIQERGGFFALIAQQKIRRMIEVMQPSKRIWPLQKICTAYAMALCKIAEWRDRHDRYDLQQKFTIGYGIIARKK